MTSCRSASAALVVANQRLYKLRAQCAKEKESVAEKPAPSSTTAAQQTPTQAALPDLITLPAHLGWHSKAVSQVLQKRKYLLTVQEPVGEAFSPDTIITATSDQPQSFQNETLSLDVSQTIKIYPDIALAMLRQEETAAGRLWLLLRHLDKEGRGVLRVVNIRETLANAKRKHKLCGWRQLRNLLRQGEGIFWQRDKHHIWLRSAGRVAGNLGVIRLTGRPVALPVKHLLGSIGEARAYLYASFHAGRQSSAEQRVGQKPIARETLTTLTGLTAECQRGYERRVGVRVSPNYVVGECSTNKGKEEGIWRRGKSAFSFIDHRGGQGRPGREYIAWQLPNSYTVALTHRPKGRQKRINRKLSDLFMQGMTGNEQRSIEKRYFGDGAGAVRAVSKQTQAQLDVYWLDSACANGRLRWWHVLSSEVAK